MPLFRGRDRRDRIAERRDPTAATTALRWHGKDQAQVPDWDAQRAVQFGYQANVIAFRCVKLISETLASIKFRAGAEQPEDVGVPAPHNPDARLAQLLGPGRHGPAPKLSAKKLWAWTAAQRLVTGRNGWEIELDGQRVVALWPLTSSALKAIPSSGGNEWFTGFEYGRPDDLRSLSVDQVHYGWDGQLSDFRQPESSLNSAKYPVEVASAIERYQYNFMKNGAIPGTIVGVEAFAEAADFEAFKRQWGMSYEGPDNAGRTHFVELDPDDGVSLDSGIFVQSVGATMRDSRTPESYKQALELVAISFGVPWSKLDASGRTFDNASEEDRTFWESTILPLATDLQDEVNAGLAPRLGPEVGWFDFSRVRALQPVPVASPQEIPGLYMGGIITAEEARRMLYLTGPAPAVPASTTVEVEENDDESGAVDGGSAEAAEGSERAQEGLQARRQEGTRRQEVDARALVDFQEARRAAIWRTHESLVVRQERVWERQWRVLFARQSESALARLQGTARSKVFAKAAEAREWRDRRGPADGVFDPAFWLNETEDMAAGLYAGTADVAFGVLEGRFGIAFDLESEFAQRFIRGRANQLAGQVTTTTYQAITATLADGVAAGEGVPSLASRVRDVFIDADQRRSTMIARTEVISAFNASSNLAASTLPADVVAAKEWIATADGRTRPSHITAGADQVVHMSQPFAVGGEGAMYPGDPSLSAKESVNCRCTVAFLTPDEWAAWKAAKAAEQAQQPVPISRARLALALVDDRFDEGRFRRALEVAV